MISQETDNEEIEILYNTRYGRWVISNKAMELYKLRKTINFNYYLHKRNDPILVQIYKELGDEFDGKEYSRTSSKKIPKKYENYYYISEHDGLEIIEIDYTGYKMYNLMKNIKGVSAKHNSK